MLSCLPKSSRRVLLDRQLKNPNHHYTLRREQGSKTALKSTNCNKCSHNLNNYLVTLMLQRIRDRTHRTRGREEKEKRMSSLLLRSFISKLAIASDVQKTEDCSYTTAAALLCCIPRFPNTSSTLCKKLELPQNLIYYHHRHNRNNLLQLLPALIVLSPPSIQQKQHKKRSLAVCCLESEKSDLQPRHTTTNITKTIKRSSSRSRARNQRIRNGAKIATTTTTTTVLRDLLLLRI